MDLSEIAVTAIRKIAARVGVNEGGDRPSRVEVIRRALAVYDMVTEHEAAGWQLALVDPKDPSNFMLVDARIEK